MKRRILSSLMALVLVFGLLPATAFAEGETVPDGKAKIGNNVYNTLDEAMDAVEEGGTATIYLGKGTYSGNTAKTDPGKGAGKSLLAPENQHGRLWLRKNMALMAGATTVLGTAIVLPLRI